MNINDINNDILTCQKCPLSGKLPNNCSPVPGVGNVKAEIMIIGEAPGSNEILLSEPFVGIAGKYLNNMLSEANIDRNNVYITNVVKCRPTDNGTKNRTPNKFEILTCSRFLVQEIISIKPKYIFTLGKIPTKALIDSKLKNLKDVIGKKFHYTLKETFQGVTLKDGVNITLTVIPNYHPSFLLQYGKSYTDTAINIFKSIK